MKGISELLDEDLNVGDQINTAHISWPQRGGLQLTINFPSPSRIL